MKGRELGPKKPSSSGTGFKPQKVVHRLTQRLSSPPRGPTKDTAAPVACSWLEREHSRGVRGLGHPHAASSETATQDHSRANQKAETRTPKVMMTNRCRSGRRLGSGKPTPMPHAMEHLAKNVSINTGWKEGEEHGEPLHRQPEKSQFKEGRQRGGRKKAAVHTEKVGDSQRQEDEPNKRPAPKVKAEPALQMAGRLQEGLRRGPYRGKEQVRMGGRLGQAGIQKQPASLSGALSCFRSLTAASDSGQQTDVTMLAPGRLWGACAHKLSCTPDR